MTTSGGMQRPTPSEAQEAQTQVDAPAVGPGAPAHAPRPAADPSAAGTADHNGSSGGQEQRLGGGYDVAAALRAQASRAAQATRSAAQRVQDAMTPTPIDSEGSSAAPGDAPTTRQPSHAATTGSAAAAAAAAVRPQPAAAAPAQAYATGPGPATAPYPAARPPEPSPEPARSRVAPPVSAPAATPRRTGRVRKARLRLLRLDPWSVMKTAFLLSVAIGIMLFVAVAVIWSVLDAAGVFTAVGDVVRDLTASETSAGIDIEGFVAMSRVLGFATLVAVVDVVLVTALATLGAFLYNLSASLLGGLEVTLAEDD